MRIIVVSGAGDDRVNGPYTESGSYQGRPVFSMNVDGAFAKIFSLGANWLISWHNSVRYKINTGGHGLVPPPEGWVVAEGTMPPPKVCTEPGL